VGLRVGGEVAANDLPEGWTEGTDITCNPKLKIGSTSIEGVIRYLGVFLGAPEGVSRAWAMKTTQKIKAKADQWRERRMPTTRTGRAVALRNSILAQAWYLVDNQVPPRLEDMLNTWRKEEWEFMADTTLPSNREARGSTQAPSATNVAHMTLIQDHAEGGKRITDVEGFARALKTRQLRHMAEPRPSPHTAIQTSYYTGLTNTTVTCDKVNDSSPPPATFSISTQHLRKKSVHLDDSAQRSSAPPRTEYNMKQCNKQYSIRI
jgi:hypothetical protein